MSCALNPQRIIFIRLYHLYSFVVSFALNEKLLKTQVFEFFRNNEIIFQTKLYSPFKELHVRNLF